MTCAWCGTADGTRPVLAQDVCEPCWTAFRDPIIERLIIEDHTAYTLTRDGIDRPDHGTGAAMCRCVSCDATLVAIPGDPCPYCERSWERMRTWQAEKLLRYELPDPADARFLHVAKAWLDRLGRGLEAGLISESQLRTAWERRVVRVAA